MTLLAAEVASDATTIGAALTVLAGLGGSIWWAARSAFKDQVASAEKIAESNRAAMAEMATKFQTSLQELGADVKAGFADFNKSLARRDAQAENLAAKSTEITVRVVERMTELTVTNAGLAKDLGQFKSEVARDISELKAEVRNLATRPAAAAVVVGPGGGPERT